MVLPRPPHGSSPLTFPPYPASAHGSIARRLPGRLVQCRPGLVVHALPVQQLQHDQLVDLPVQRRLRVAHHGRRTVLHWYGPLPAPPFLPGAHAPDNAWTELPAASGLGGWRDAACTANTYSLNGASTCSACPTGSTSGAAASTCTCSAGYSTAGSGSSLVCSGSSQGRAAVCGDLVPNTVDGPWTLHSVRRWLVQPVRHHLPPYGPVVALGPVVRLRLTPPFIPCLPACMQSAWPARSACPRRQRARPAPATATAPRARAHAHATPGSSAPAPTCPLCALVRWTGLGGGGGAVSSAASRECLFCVRERRPQRARPTPTRRALAL